MFRRKKSRPRTALNTLVVEAVGGGVASFFSISLFIGLLSYANALVAQYFGAGEEAKCSRVVTQGLIITLLSMPLLLVITLLVGKLFAAMGHEPRQVELESIYYNLLMISCFLPLSKLCIASYFSGIGRTKVVMICDVLGMMMNVPLSYVLIFGKFGLPAMGIAGAAIGTIISSAFALVLYCSTLRRKTETGSRFWTLSSLISPLWDVI